MRAISSKSASTGNVDADAESFAAGRSIIINGDSAKANSAIHAAGCISACPAGPAGAARAARAAHRLASEASATFCLAGIN